MNNYVKQLKEFQSYMAACFDVLMNSDQADGTQEIFYNSDFTITFRGRSVTLYNGADVFTSIEEIIMAEIEESEEENA